MNILIADDNSDFRTTLKRVLEARPNIEEVWEAKDGEEVVRLAREVPVDLALLDLAMPRIDGLEATRLIKDSNPHIRIIVVSAHDEAIYRRAAHANGADGFFPKSECISGLEGVGVLKWVEPTCLPKPEYISELEQIGILKGVAPTWIDLNEGE